MVKGRFSCVDEISLFEAESPSRACFCWVCCRGGDSILNDEPSSSDDSIDGDSRFIDGFEEEPDSILKPSFMRRGGLGRPIFSSVSAQFRCNLYELSDR